MLEQFSQFLSEAPDRHVSFADDPEVGPRRVPEADPSLGLGLDQEPAADHRVVAGRVPINEELDSEAATRPKRVAPGVWLTAAVLISSGVLIAVAPIAIIFDMSVAKTFAVVLPGFLALFILASGMWVLCLALLFTSVPTFKTELTSVSTQVLSQTA